MLIAFHYFPSQFRGCMLAAVGMKAEEEETSVSASKTEVSSVGPA
jgi:hypothetical protein